MAKTLFSFVLVTDFVKSAHGRFGVAQSKLGVAHGSFGSALACT